MGLFRRTGSLLLQTRWLDKLPAAKDWQKKSYKVRDKHTREDIRDIKTLERTRVVLTCMGEIPCVCVCVPP